MLHNLTFILGGASSGKSVFAEKLVVASARPKVYLATAQAFDDEMTAKIAAHRAQRGSDWLTEEVPLEIAAVLARQPSGHVVLLDCATLWLSNVMLAGRDMAAETDALLTALAHCPCPVVVVSNEVGMGVVPDNALARQFRSAQGRINARLAAQADTAIAVMAGLPIVLKGTLP